MLTCTRPKVATLGRSLPSTAPLAKAETRGRELDPQDVVEESWRSEITSPAEFDQHQFKLLVHAYNPVMAKGFVQEAKENGTYDPKRDINLLEDPQRLREKGLVSASIVTAAHLPTFGRLLFILGFDPRDILATSPKDGSFKYKEKEFLENPPGPTLTPTELVAKTHPEEHNEVVLRSENLKIVGVAVKHMIRADGVIDTPEYADQLRSVAQERGFPVVELHQDCILEDKMEIGTDKNGVVRGVVLHHNGVGYTLSPRWQQRYFHPIQCDWEDISETEYNQIRPLLESALKSREGGLEFLETIDAKMQPRFEPP